MLNYLYIQKTWAIILAFTKEMTIPHMPQLFFLTLFVLSSYILPLGASISLIVRWGAQFRFSKSSPRFCILWTYCWDTPTLWQSMLNENRLWEAQVFSSIWNQIPHWSLPLPHASHNFILGCRVCCQFLF